jgi:rubrerythrin
MERRRAKVKLDFWLHVAGDEEKLEIERADPKRHGYWIPVKHGMHMCSVCDTYVDMVMEEFSFCPFCGAGMLTK